MFSTDDQIYGIFGENSDSNSDNSFAGDSQSSGEFIGFKKKKRGKVYSSKRKRRDDEIDREIRFVPTSSSNNSNNDSAGTVRTTDTVNEIGEKEDVDEDSPDEVLLAFEDAIGNAKERPVASGLSNDYFRNFISVESQQNGESLQLEEMSPRQQQQRQPKPTRTVPVLPSVSMKELGTWEKHTKGIGSKLLQKFGFTGRLGAKETGVSRPIEVVVRPNGVGLGFGGITESSALPVNQQVEAEWRGLPLPESAIASGTSAQRKSEAEKAASAGTWKKSAGKQKKGQSRIVAQTASELLAQYTSFSGTGIGTGMTTADHQVIIDMRHSEVRVLSDMSQINVSTDTTGDKAPNNGPPLLGEELLHNLSMLVDMTAVELATTTRLRDGEGGVENQKIRREEEQNKLARQKEILSSRVTSLERFSLVVQRVAAKHIDGVETSRVVRVKDATRLLMLLHESFPKEFLLFGAVHLLPTLIEPLLQRDFRNWDPCAGGYEVPGEKEAGTEIDPLIELSEAWLALNEYFESVGEHAVVGQARSHLEGVADRIMAPPLRRATATGEWLGHSDRMDALVRSYTQARLLLSAELVNELEEVSLLPRLSIALNEWGRGSKSSVSRARDQASDSRRIFTPHALLLPWLPQLRRRLSQVYPDVRRKLSQWFSYWDGRSDDAIQLVRPWIGVFDHSSMERFITNSVVPRLAAALRGTAIDPASQDTIAIEIALQWSVTTIGTDCFLVPEPHRSCLWLGEFFPRWLRALAQWLCSPGVDLDQIAVWYGGWKGLLSPLLQEPHARGQGSTLEAPFAAALRMMSAVLDDNEGAVSSTHTVDSLWSGAGCSGMEKRTYMTLLEARMEEKRMQERVKELGGQSGVGLSRRNVTGGVARATFKEVVEAFAAANGVEFTPRQQSNKSFGSVGGDGVTRQMYMFGGKLCYIEHDVVYTQLPLLPAKPMSQGPGQNVKWQPIDLEELLAIVKVR